MDEQSTSARDLVAAYRRGRTLDADARARVQARLAASIAAPEPVIGPAPHGRRRVVIAAAVAIAAAAALVVVVRGWTGAKVEVEGSSERGQAPYEHRETTEPQPVSDEILPPTRQPAVEPVPVIETPVIAPSTPRAGAPRTAKPDDTAPAEDTSLAEELAIVRRVRAALDRDDADAALAAIGEHERRFASGQLVEERKSLRVEALCRAGKLAQARAESTTFLREHPGSAHADRVRSACPR